MLHALLLLLLLPRRARATPPPVPLTLLDPAAHPLARCMDGSPGGFYLARNASSDQWVVELQGGGECATRENCDARRGSALASSKHFPATVQMRFLSVDDPRNLYLRTWNRVLLPYCSQDLWTGQRANATDATFGYYFAGHHILAAVLDALGGALAGATDVVLTGESAGGIGVWPNVDYVAARYPQARVVAAPIAGFYFFADPYTGPGHTSSGLADFREPAWPSHYALWQSFVDADCQAGLRDAPWRCILANYTFPFVAADAFVTQSQTDKVVLLYHDWVPKQDPHWTPEVRAYMSAWHANMTTALAPSMDPASRNGVFNAACFIHTESSLDGPLLGGYSFV